MLKELLEFVFWFIIGVTIAKLISYNSSFRKRIKPVLDLASIEVDEESKKQFTHYRVLYLTIGMRWFSETFELAKWLLESNFNNQKVMDLEFIESLNKHSSKNFYVYNNLYRLSKLGFERCDGKLTVSVWAKLTYELLESVVNLKEPEIKDEEVLIFIKDFESNNIACFNIELAKVLNSKFFSEYLNLESRFATKIDGESINIALNVLMESGVDNGSLQPLYRLHFHMRNYWQKPGVNFTCSRYEFYQYLKSYFISKYEVLF